jgi:putative exosortase-associated protein (TIGR04073 family)
MNTYHHFFVAGLLTGLSLVYTSTALANDMYQQQNQQQYQQPPREKSYSEKVGDKAKSGITNIATSWLEVPKSIINDTNAKDSNIVYGLVGGGLEGMLNMLGRATVGVADLVTAPLATKPIVRPQYIWEDFDQTNIYGDVFRLDSNGNNNNEQRPQIAPSNNPYMQ